MALAGLAGIVGLCSVVLFLRTGKTPPEELTPFASERSSPEPAPVSPRPAAPTEPPLPEPPLPEPPLPEPSLPEPSLTPEAQMAALKKEAVEVVDSLVKDIPHSSEPLALLGKVYGVQGNSAEAVKCWEKCLELNPHRADVRQNLALTAMRKGEYEAAEAHWRKMLAAAPKTPGIHNYLARALICQGKIAQAVAEAEEDVRILPRAYQSHCLLGETYLQLKEYHKAKKSFQTAIDIRADYADAYYGLATVWARLGHKDESQECREKFKQLVAVDLEAKKNRGAAYDDLASVRRSVAEAYSEAGRIRLKNGHLRRAEQHWQRAATLDSSNTACRLELAWLYEQQENREREALQLYEQVVKLEPENALAWMYTGKLHARLEQFDAAEEAVRKVIQLAPQRSTPYDSLAQLYLHLNKNLAEAKTAARKAVELEPSAPHFVTLSRACEKNGDRPGALSALRRAVELDAGNARYKQMLRSLEERE